MISRISRRPIRAALALVALIGAGGLLTSCDVDLSLVFPACTHSWIGPADGDFGTAANWDTGTVPGSTDRACSDPGSSIVVTSPQSVDSLDTKGTLTVPVGSTLQLLSAQHISLANELQIDGTLENGGTVLAGGIGLTGTLQGTGGIRVTGSVPSSLAGGRVGGTQTLSIGDNSGLHGAVQLCDDAVLDFAVRVTVDAPTDVTDVGCPLAGNPRITVGSAATFTVDGPFTSNVPLVNEGAVLVESAQLQASSFTQTSGSTTLTGSSSIRVGGGSGTVAIDGGTISGTGAIEGSLSGSGTFVPGAGSAGTLTVTGDFTPTGSVEFELGGTHPGIDMPTITASGAVVVTGANLVATLSPGYTPSPTASFLLIGPTQPVGPFATATVPAPFGVIYGATGLQVGPSCNATLYHPGSNLNGANLVGADLNHCDLAGASFIGADLTGADLSGSTLTSANFTGANLTSANLSNTTVISANLTDATITGANLHVAIGLNTVTGLLGTLTHGWTGVNFGGTGLDLHGQDITQGGSNTALDNADLSGANLSGADLTGANLSYTDLTGASLGGAQLTGASFYSAKLNETDLSNASLPYANLEGADIRGTILTGADLSYASGNPMFTLSAVYSNTMCPLLVNSDDNGGNCEGWWPSGG